MSFHHEPTEKRRPKPDQVLVEMAEYVTETVISSAEAYKTAHACLLDALGCALLALRYPECSKLLGPIVPGTVVPHGARVPGTSLCWTRYRRRLISAR